MLSYWKEKRPVNKAEAWIISWALLFFCLIGVSKGTLELHWTDNRSCPTCLFHHSWDCTTTFRGGRRGNLLLSTWRSQRLEMWVDALCGFFYVHHVNVVYGNSVYLLQRYIHMDFQRNFSVCCCVVEKHPTLVLVITPCHCALSHCFSLWLLSWLPRSYQMQCVDTWKQNNCQLTVPKEIDVSSQMLSFFSNMKWSITSPNLLCWCCRWKNMLWLRNLYSLRTLSPQLWSGLQR